MVSQRPSCVYISILRKPCMAVFLLVSGGGAARSDMHSVSYRHDRINARTIGRAEAVDGPLPITPANVERLREELEGRGVIFLCSTADRGVGVQLVKRRRSGRSPKKNETA